MTLLSILGLAGIVSFSPANAATPDAPPLPPADALAQDDDGEEYDDDDGDDGDDDEGWYSKQKKEQAAQEETLQNAEPAPSSGPPIHWKTDPFLKPVIGANVFGAGTETYVSLSLGAEAGLHYRQDKPDPLLMGTARVRGEYLLGTGVKGTEVRVGNFIGPWWKFIGLQTGPDVFWNKYSYGTITLDPVTGLGWPVMALMDLVVINLYGGLEPAWYLSSTGRPQVDWSQQDTFGFGQEFTWFAGATIDLKVARVGLTWSRRTTAFGVQQGYGLGLKVGG